MPLPRLVDLTTLQVTVVDDVFNLERGKPHSVSFRDLEAGTYNFRVQEGNTPCFYPSETRTDMGRTLGKMRADAVRGVYADKAGRAD